MIQIPRKFNVSNILFVLKVTKLCIMDIIIADAQIEMKHPWRINWNILSYVL